MCQRVRKISQLSSEEKLEIQHVYLNQGMNAAIRKLNLALGYAMPQDARTRAIQGICKEEIELVPDPNASVVGIA